MQDFPLGRTVFLAIQTLGIVFGDVGTSPLYTFTVMFNKAPIHGEEDVLGALSLVLYTLILIPLIKYVLVVLWANDNGEGASLYSVVHLLFQFSPTSCSSALFWLLNLLQVEHLHCTH